MDYNSVKLSSQKWLLFLLFTQSHKFIFSIKLETMIIVKDKGTKRPIYVPRNVNLQPSINNNSGEGGINEDELNKYLKGYITEEELNDALNNIGDTNIVELTQAEYDVLVTNGDVDEETIYLITDSVSNIKTINGESLIGEGDITIEGGSTNIIELTQEEYDNLEEKDENTIYVITDAPVIDTPDTSIFITESELLEMGYATQGYVDEKLGNIETVLDSIIGDSNGGGNNGSSIFPLNN